MRAMRSMVCVGAVMAAGMVMAPAALAEGRVSVGVSGGTLGISPEVSFRFADHAGVRVNGGFYDYQHDDDFDDIRYDADLKLNSFGAMFDWYPAGGGLRLSAGVRANGNEIDLLGTPTTSVEIGNVTYSPAQVGTLSGTIRTKDVAPMLSIGYGGKPVRGFTLGFELGVMFQGSPRIDDLRATGALANDPTFQAQLLDEQRQIEDDADDFKLWPVVQVGFHYRF